MAHAGLVALGIGTDARERAVRLAPKTTRALPAIRAGVLVSLTSPGTSATVGGVSSLGGAALIALAFPVLTRYAAKPDRRAVPTRR